jgi:uncharacterized protein YutE (UPF0331/DUF86 family)
LGTFVRGIVRMDWLQFISSIVGSIAWPVAIAIVALIFKKPLQDLLSRITDFELWGSKATFTKELKQAEEAADRIEPQPRLRIDSSITPDDPYLELAERFPEAAVIKSYKMVEQYVSEISTSATSGRRSTPREIVQSLVREGRISHDVYNLFRQIMNTRNAAVHAGGKTISPGEAIAYRDLCDRLVTALKSAVVGLMNEVRGE